MKRKIVLVMLVLCVVLALGAAVNAQDLIPIRMQLKWVTQAQFAGYYAALNQGYYKDEGLDVTIQVGGPDINEAQVVASGGAEFGTTWIGNLLSSREQGSGLTHIAQIFQRSGMRELTWKDSGLKTITDLKGKTVGVWGFGNQFPLFAGLVKNGIDPENPDDITIFNQPFDMNAFLNHEIDAAAAMTYNEMAQVLEFVGEDGKFPVYTMDDLNVIDLNEVGTALLEDLVFVNEKWLADKTNGVSNEDIAVKFLRATFRGWAYCRDNASDCVDYVLKEGSTLGKGHQAWMMNEINKLIWPSENGIGILDTDAFKQSADISLKYKVITKEPDKGAYRTDLAQKAVDGLAKDYPDLDLKGLDWKAADVKITAKGE
jgi:NitT/TauT family transport system substrate-binding protein